MITAETGYEHLKLIVVENDRRERMLTLEGSCRHTGEIIVARFVRDLSDTETCYGKCTHCKAWVIRTTWLGSRDTRECCETRLMTVREIEAHGR